MDRLIRRDVLSGGLLALLALLYFLASLDLPAGESEPGPSFFPRLLAASLFVLGSWIGSNGLRGTCDAELPDTRRPAVLIGATILYVALFARAGYVVSTLAYAAFAARLFGGRGITTLAVSLGATAVVYWLFAIALTVPLP